MAIMTEDKAACTMRKNSEKMVAPFSRSNIRKNLISMGYKYVQGIYSLRLTDSKKVWVEIVRSYITEHIDLDKMVFTV